MKRFVCLLFLAFLLSALPCAAQENDAFPAGEYDVIGWDPGATSAEPSYSGTAKMWKNGESYLFEASMDGQRYTGVALYDEPTSILAIQFNGTDGFGLTLLRRNGEQLEGNWVFGENPSEKGREVWTRRD